MIFAPASPLLLFEGESCRSIAERFDIAPSTVVKWSRRERWKRASRHLDPTRLVFIDETWIKTNMAPIRGWGPKGERLAGFAPDGRWHTLTFLAALRFNALTEPCVVDGPINGVIFRAYIEQFLVPTLRPGAMVVLDNLGSHRAQSAQTSIIKPAQSSRFCRRIRPISTPSSMSSPR
jgi:DDE superfamily endonuclease